ncbi:hypothetical protein TAMA11512_00020 [Selenomonas sp. TAMA-11512]|nr:hypothetical protein TAMA11512_00020 [Selenomonas sp. TAMA-11512]
MWKSAADIYGILKACVEKTLISAYPFSTESTEKNVIPIFHKSYTVLCRDFEQSYTYARRAQSD